MIHTAFHHDDSSGEGYKAGVLADLAAIHAITKALAGSKKVFIMSSASGFLGDTGPIPAEEQYPFDPEAPSRLRANNERVCLPQSSSKLVMQSVVQRVHSGVGLQIDERLSSACSKSLMFKTVSEKEACGRVLLAHTL